MNNTVQGPVGLFRTNRGEKKILGSDVELMERAHFKHRTTKCCNVAVEALKDLIDAIKGRTICECVSSY